MTGIRLRALAATYFKIGNTTFGGGDPTMLALKHDLMDNKRLLTPEQFALTFTLSRVTPGTNMLAFCAATGYLLRGWWGAIVAVAAIAVPSSMLAVIVSGAFESWMSNAYGAAAINATLAAAVGMMFAGAWMIVKPHLRAGAWTRTLVILSGAFGLTWWVHLTPLQVIGIAAVVGAFWRERPAR